MAFVARGTTINVKEINKTKQYIQKAVDYQMMNKGFSLVEILCPCPTNWNMNTKQACDHIAEVVTQYYPLGVMKDIEGGVAQ